MKRIWYLFLSLFMYRDWEDDIMCVAKKECQETKSFEGTEHEGIDVCEDGCVRGKSCWKFKPEPNGS